MKEEGMQVNGATMQSFLEGLGSFKAMALDILEKTGIPRDFQPNMDHWYDQQKWLSAFEIIGQRVGPNTLKAIGVKIPENAQFPPDIQDVPGAMKSLDVAYHMNHKNIKGEILFDPNRNPPMLEGIGHYSARIIPGEKMVIMKCDNPYPDDFDLGLITAVARKFGSGTQVRHDDTKPCRKNGADSCTYIINWV